MIHNKSFEEITFQDIEQLIVEAAPEGQNLEYKAKAWERNDEGVREMLRDISSFSNAYGGLIIIGLSEEDGLPKATQTVEKAEEERDRIFASCLVNIHPRIPGFNLKCLSNGTTNLLIIWAPHSLRAPHLITFKGLNQFWIRHDRQKSIMSVEEIKDSFLRSSAVTDTAKSFIFERRQENMAESKGQPMFILGALPLGVQEELVNVGDGELRNLFKNPNYTRTGGWNFTFSYDNAHPSLDGLVVGGKQEEYKKMELFRTGYLEGRVSLGEQSYTIREHVKNEKEDIPVLYGWPLVEFTYSFVSQVEQIQKYLGIETQTVFFVSLLNILGHGLRKYRPGTIGDRSYLEVWKKIKLEIPPITFETIDKDHISKTITDRIWQAFGYDGSDNFYTDGKFDRGLLKG